MALVFLDGFDKYTAGSGTNDAITSANLQQRWGSVPSNLTIVPGLSATGYAVQFSGNTTLGTQSLGGTKTTILFGFRVNTNNGGNTGIRFWSGVTGCAWVATNSSGNLQVGSGTVLGGSVIATSAQSVASSSTHFIEGKLVFSTTGTGEYHIYLDGIITSLDATGATFGAVNADSFDYHSGTGSTPTLDDFYIFDTTGSRNNALLLTNPRVETDFPTSDSAVQFTAQVGVLGRWESGDNNTSAAPGANQLVLRKYTPQVNCTLNSIGIVPQGTSVTAKFKGVAYGDTGGVAHTLLSSGTEVVGCTGGNRFNAALVTPQALTAGTPVWIGYITDTSVSVFESDGNASASKVANTYASGAPATAPAMTAGQPSWSIYGNLTAMAHNFAQENQVPPSPGNLNGTNTSLNYNQDSTVGHEDLFNFGALSTVPNTIYAAVVYGSVQNSDAGARTVSLRMKSAGTDFSGGAVAPGTSFAYIQAVWEVDPATNSPWLVAALNSATSGYRIET